MLLGGCSAMHHDKRDASIVFKQVALSKRTMRICSNAFVVQRISTKHVFDSSNKFDVKYCENRVYFRCSLWFVSMPHARYSCQPERITSSYTNCANCIDSLASTAVSLSVNLEGLVWFCRAKIHRFQKRFKVFCNQNANKIQQFERKISGLFSVICRNLLY